MVKIDKKQICLIVIGVLLIVGLIAWDVFRGNVSDTGTGVDAVRSDIRAAQQQQQSAIDGLGRIESGLDDSAAKAGTISEGLGSNEDELISIGFVHDGVFIKINAESGEERNHDSFFLSWINRH